MGSENLDCTCLLKVESVVESLLKASGDCAAIAIVELIELGIVEEKSNSLTIDSLSCTLNSNTSLGGFLVGSTFKSSTLIVALSSSVCKINSWFPAHALSPTSFHISWIYLNILKSFFFFSFFISIH